MWTVFLLRIGVDSPGISFDVETEIKTEESEENGNKPEIAPKNGIEESSEWDYENKFDTSETSENCKKCAKLSKGESTEKLRHSKNCSERTKDFQCQECDQSFSSYKNLKRHTKNVHNKVTKTENENEPDENLVEDFRLEDILSPTPIFTLIVHLSKKIIVCIPTVYSHTLSN